MIDGHIAIIGAGNMGRALIGGLVRSGAPPARLRAGEARAATRQALAREFGIGATADNLAAIAGAAVVVIAVKPQEAQAVLQSLAGALSATHPLVISVAAGVRIASLAAWCGAGVPIVRAMPNRPALIGAGVTGLYAPPDVGATQRQSAEEVLRAVGEIAWVPSEEALDVVTALSGSGPAYFFLLAEHMAEAGHELGLEAGTARRLAAATLYGAGLLAHSGDGDFVPLRSAVTSAGGTTEAALAALEAANLGAVVRQALSAATQRGRELAMHTR